MGKGIYAKPLMKIEQFTPNQSVAVCWYVEKEQMFTKLYQDTKTAWGLDVIYGTYQNGEQISLPTPTDIPENGYIKDSYPTNIAPTSTGKGSFYTSYHYSWPANWYDDPEETVYKYETGGTTYYFRHYEKAPNHS